MADIVYVVGLGPGDPQFLTAQAQSALEEAEVLCGYPVYLDLVRPYYPEKEYYATGMTKELGTGNCPQRPDRGSGVQR